MQLELFSPTWRGDDPDTSRLAAQSISKTNLTASRQAILGLFQKHGSMFDENLAAYYSALASDGSAPYLSPSGLRSRRSELCEAGYLEDSGNRGKTHSGRATIIWQITDKGRYA